MRMSSNISGASDIETPEWFLQLMGQMNPVTEGAKIVVAGLELQQVDGVLRASTVMSDEQRQTEETFGFKWHKRETFESEASRNMMQKWSSDRYLPAGKWFQPQDRPYVVLDAGCGASYTGLEYFRPILDRIQYLGSDISASVDVARQRMRDAGADAAFLQCDLTQLPLPPASLDAIFSEGVLHHTDSTRGAIRSLAPLLKEGGLFMFYVYKKKGPIREFSDDYIRAQMQDMTPAEGWEAMLPISKLGQVLGELNIEIDVPEKIGLLGIDAGKINLQRFFYWHVLKSFYRPEYTLDEMNHINFDWFAPKNAFRQTPEQVRQWCEEAGLDIEREQVEEAGITIVARKRK